jgi:UDP-glucose 4-epimerase
LSVHHGFPPGRPGHRERIGEIFFALFASWRENVGTELGLRDSPPMRTVLITGGAGFIGSHLAEALLDRGVAVRVLDDLSTGCLRNVEPLKERPGFRCAVGSIFDESAVAALLDGCDAVVHLAAAVGVRLIVESPVRTIETNVHGTEIVLRHAARRGTPVLLASTSEVYGKSEKVPYAEEDDHVLGPTTRGRWSYAASKLVDEFLALSYGKEKGLPVVIARLFNTVGPRQTGRYGMVIPSFVRQALAGGPLTVYGDGKQSRCFADVGDVVGALVKLLDEPRARGQVYNVGNDEEITIRALAERVVARAGVKAEIRHVPYDEAYEAGFEDMRRRVPDLRKIKALIGYKPTTGIDAILDRVIAYERAQGDAAKG